MELGGQDSKAFEDFLAFLQSHPEIEKYELDKETGLLRLDRVLYASERFSAISRKSCLPKRSMKSYFACFTMQIGC